MQSEEKYKYTENEKHDKYNQINKKKKEEKKKVNTWCLARLKITYSSGYSLVVTDPTTNPPITGLTRGERTGSRAFQYLWPYVEGVCGGGA